MIAEAATAESVLAIVPDDDCSKTATVERYYVEAKATVCPGDPIALLRSARYVFDIPAQREGEVLELLVPEGAEVAVGCPILRLQPGRLPPEPPAGDSAVQRGRMRATPLARKIALLHGYALETISGSGAAGCIRAADIRSRLPQSVATAQQPVGGRHSTAGSRPTPANREQGYHFAAPWGDAPEPRALSTFEVDMHKVAHATPCDGERLRRRGIEVTPLSRVAYAIIAALREHRILNSRWTGNGMLLYGRVHLGWVMEAPEGVVEAIIPNACDLSPLGLARALATADRSRPLVDTCRLRAAGPTFTVVTNAGACGWWSPPGFSSRCGAILSLGATERQPVVIERPAGAAIAVRERALFTLAFDARYLSFDQAGAFMSSVRRRVEQWREIC